MPIPDPPNLYKRFFIDKQDERVELFRKVAVRFDVKRALYPGSFVHISPSFVIPSVVYVDTDRRTPKFFQDELLAPYIESRKEYAEAPEIGFHHQSYDDPIDEPLGSFDLLISQYAGFISTACSKYLRIGGLLLANDSHGDASMAVLDSDFELVAAVTRRGERFSIKETDLDQYLQPANPVEFTQESLRDRGRGIRYTKPAFAYLFRRIR